MFNDPMPPDASRLLYEFLSKFGRPAPPRWPPHWRTVDAEAGLLELSAATQVW
jgi:hypothetical protein